MRILLVEDSADLRFLLKLQLEEVGHSVLLAEEAGKALELAASELPDLIISDIRMSGMDGHELIRKLRLNPKSAYTPCIALSGHTSQEDVESALAAGFDAFVRKPVDPDELARVVQMFATKERRADRGRG